MRLILLCLLCLFPATILWAQSTSTINIGAIYNLTGRQAPLGVPSSQGAELAVAQINQNQGILDRSVHLDLKNGQTNPEILVKIAEGFVKNDHVNLIIGLNDDNMVLVVAPLITAAGKLFVTSGATSPLLPLLIPHRFYMACFGDNTQAAAAAEFAYQKLKVRHAVVLYDEGMDYTKELRKYFIQAFKQLGGNVVFQAAFSHRYPSIDKQIQIIKQLKKKPQLIYLAAGPTELPALIRAIRRAGLLMPIMGGDSYVGRKLVAQDKASANNVYYTTHAYFSLHSGAKKDRQFVDAYMKKFHRLPTAGAGLAYDAVYLLKKAIVKAKSISPEAVAKALQSIRGFVGVTGTMSYSAQQHMPKKSVAIVRIQSGKASLVDEWQPTNVPVAQL